MFNCRQFRCCSVFSIAVARFIYNLKFLNRNAFAITGIEPKFIAKATMFDINRISKAGHKPPQQPTYQYITNKNKKQILFKY